ncbi:MAG: ferritin-like domain-containing protein [Spirochaetaceae bacterium]
MDAFDYSIDCARRLKKMYSEYSKAVVDEGLRKFFSSMGEQEVSHIQFLKEKKREHAAHKATMQRAEEVTKELGDPPPEKEVASMDKLDFLSHAAEMEEQTMNLYKKVLDCCNDNSEFSSIFKSLYDEEKRHLALVKDRYDLESLM